MKVKMRILENCNREAYIWLANHLSVQYKPNLINTLESAT